MSFSIYEDEDCRVPGTVVPGPDAGASETGLTMAHMPPPPSPLPPHAFMAQVPSDSPASAETPRPRSWPRPGQQQQQGQLLTPVDTPAARVRRGEVPAGARTGGVSPQGGEATTTPEQAGQHHHHHHHQQDWLQTAPRQPLPSPSPSPSPYPSPSERARARAPRPHDGAGVVRTPRRGWPPRVARKEGGGHPRGGRRRRRRTEVELTMYHAIRWSGLGDVVPNVSVVTGAPLVRMPLPCTFGGRGEGEDFAVALSRGVVREIRKRWAGRVRMTGKGV